MNAGIAVLAGLLACLVIISLRMGIAFQPVVKRFIEQFAMLVPRMLCALIAAGFIAELIPKSFIAGYLGDDAGLAALPVAALAGLAVPSGPVVLFAIAAVFARSGATPAALVTFITSWSMFALHRTLIYEIPLLGLSFLRFRTLSVLAIPFVAGLMAMAVGLVTSFGHPLTMP